MGVVLSVNLGVGRVFQRALAMIWLFVWLFFTGEEGCGFLPFAVWGSEALAGVGKEGETIRSAHAIGISRILSLYCAIDRLSGFNEKLKNAIKQRAAFEWLSGRQCNVPNSGLGVFAFGFSAPMCKAAKVFVGFVFRKC